MARGGPEDGHRDAARDDGDDHRDDEAGVHESGRGQTADQRRGDHEERPQELRRAARRAPAVRAHCAACAWGARRNVTETGADPTSVATQV